MVQIVLLAFLGLAGCSFFSPSLLESSGQIMGTWYHIKWSDADLEVAKEDIEKGILDELEQVDRLMSTYKPDSELSLFNQSPAGEWFPLSDETLEVFSIAGEISELSGGAFDVTVGELVNLWGFGPQYKPETVPDPEALGQALKSVGFRHLELDQSGKKVLKEQPIYVDLSAVAKGYAVDQVAEYLDKLGVEAYLVEVGGEVRTKGHKPDGSVWRVAIESPVPGERRIQDVLELTDMGMATSGDYRNFYEEDGVRYSHTIDPRTGYPIKHSLASVTVLHPKVGYADAWATAMMVLGEQEGLKVANDQGLAVLFLVKKESSFEELASEMFKQQTGMRGE